MSTTFKGTVYVRPCGRGITIYDGHGDLIDWLSEEITGSFNGDGDYDVEITVKSTPHKDDEPYERDDHPIMGDRVVEQDAPPTHRYWCEACFKTFPLPVVLDTEVTCPDCGGILDNDQIPF